MRRPKFEIIELEREVYEDLKRIAWESFNPSRLKREPLSELVLTVYLTGVKHGAEINDKQWRDSYI